MAIWRGAASDTNYDIRGPLWSFVSACTHPAFCVLSPPCCLRLQVLEILEETGFAEDRFYIHCDGALFGLMVRDSCLPLRLLLRPLHRNHAA